MHGQVAQRLRWTVYRAQLPPGFVNPAEGFDAHAPILIYQVENVQRLEYPERPSLTLAPGEAVLVDDSELHRHVNPTRSTGTHIVFGLNFGSGPGTVLGVSEILPGVELGPGPLALSLFEFKGAAGTHSQRLEAPGPLTLLALDGPVAASDLEGTTTHNAGEVWTVPGHTAFELAAGEERAVHVLAALLASPADAGLRVV